MMRPSLILIVALLCPSAALAAKAEHVCDKKMPETLADLELRETEIGDEMSNIDRNSATDADTLAMRKNCETALLVHASAVKALRKPGRATAVTQAIFGGTKLKLHIGETNVQTDANSDLPLGIDDDQATRGVTFGYSGKTFVKDALGYWWSDQKWLLAPEKNSYQNLLFWDAFKVDLEVGQQRTLRVKEDAMGQSRFRPREDTTFNWAFKYEVDIGKMFCLVAEKRWGEECLD
ncbi:MAG: hypothetical protein ACE5FL_12300 [Myxococcota bacterium]